MQRYVILGLLSVLSLSAFAAPMENKTFDAEALKQLIITNRTDGNISIQAYKTTRIVAYVSKTQKSNACLADFKQVGDTLTVETTTGSARCKLNLKFKVPKQLALQLTAGAGNISVKGTNGSIQVNAGSGNTLINATVTQLESRIGSGYIDVRGLAGNAQVMSVSGRVELAYATVPEEGELTVHTGSGDVEIKLPKDSKVVTNYLTATGETHSDISNAQDAQFKVNVRTGSGDLSMHRPFR